MLDRIVAVELIPDFVAKTVRPYMAEHGLDEDKILHQNVKVGDGDSWWSVLLATCNLVKRHVSFFTPNLNPCGESVSIILFLKCFAYFLCQMMWNKFYTDQQVFFVQYTLGSTAVVLCMSRHF